MRSHSVGLLDQFRFQAGRIFDMRHWSNDFFLSKLKVRRKSAITRLQIPKFVRVTKLTSWHCLQSPPISSTGAEQTTVAIAAPSQTGVQSRDPFPLSHLPGLPTGRLK